MKQVKLGSPPVNPDVFVNQCCSDKYYGVRYGGSTSSTRGFITRQDFRSGNYIARAKDSATEGNGWTQFFNGNINQLIEALLRNGLEVFEFDTADQLFRWVGGIC